MIFDEISKYKIAAELIGTFVSKGSALNKDFNELIETGVYKIQGDGINNQPNLPQGAYQYGMLLVFRILNDAEDRVLQIYVSHNPTIVYVRMNNSMRWKNWVKLSSTILE